MEKYKDELPPTTDADRIQEGRGGFPFIPSRLNSFLCDKEDLAANGPDGSAPVASALQEPPVRQSPCGVKARVRSPLGPHPRSGGRRSTALHQQRGGRAAMRKSHRRGRLCRHHLEPRGERRLSRSCPECVRIRQSERHAEEKFALRKLGLFRDGRRRDKKRVNAATLPVSAVTNAPDEPLPR
jgi:hypothetical protein